MADFSWNARRVCDVTVGVAYRTVEHIAGYPDPVWLWEQDGAYYQFLAIKLVVGDGGGEECNLHVSKDKYLAPHYCKDDLEGMGMYKDVPCFVVLPDGRRFRAGAYEFCTLSDETVSHSALIYSKADEDVAPNPDAAPRGK